MRPIDIYYKTPYFIRYPAFVITGAIQARRRYGKGFKTKYAYLMNNLNLSEIEVIKLQTDLMKLLLCHAYTNVPYYRKIFDDAGFNPNNYKNVEDLKKIPVLTKEIIRNNFNDLIDSNYRNIVKHSSGGTTGEPIQFYLPKNLKGDFNYATLYRFYSWGGVEFGERRVSIAGRLITKKPPYSMHNLAEKQLYVCAHHLGSENLDNIVNSIMKFRPSFIQGHPSAISVVADYMKQHNIKICVKAIFSTSENLYQDRRELMEEVFKCRVFDTYGMGEMVAMASECSQHNGYHLAPEYGLTEIINTNCYANGYGEIVSTSLQNYAMPLIRYQTGDIGKYKYDKCPCGSNFPMLEKISGRIDDIIKLSNGKMILPLTIRIQMKNAGISDFQIVQYESNRFNVNIYGNFTEAHKKNVEYKVRNILKETFQGEGKIQIHFDKEKILTQNGKEQMIIKLND